MLNQSVVRKLGVREREASKPISVRLSGDFLRAWQEIKKGFNTPKDADALKILIKIGASIIAADETGRPPRVVINYHDRSGQNRAEDIWEFLNLEKAKTPR